ncbi:MAG: response regulator [Terriglobia bacterium]
MTHPSKILVADDDPESRELLCEVLQANGYVVRAVADGVAAREELGRDAAYLVVIADLRMPRENGLELLRNVRRQQSQPAFILMSSFISDAERRLAQEMGARALLEKPFRLTDLLQVVDGVANRGKISIAT